MVVFSLTEESDAFLVSSKPGFQGGIFRQLAGRLSLGGLS